MADVLIVAAAGDEAHAQGLAGALATLGFDASAEPSAPDAYQTAIDAAKCVIAIWTPATAADPELAIQAALARGKLVGAELRAGATPAAFHAAPKSDLATRDRISFKSRFETLLTAIEPLAGAERNAEALPDALAQARAALKPSARRGGRTFGLPYTALGLSLAFLFVVGFGVGRVLDGARVGGPPQTAAAEAAPTALSPARADAVAPSARYGVSMADLENLPWREAAAKIAPDAAEAIKAAARRGDAFAGAVACLGHMAGADGFLPSPAAARDACDAAAGEHHPAALYFSWQQSRASPHLGIDAATARERLAEAAALGWLPAQIDYALLLADSFRAPNADQVQAGRLFLAAAERGDPRGQYHYARWLRDSPAGPRDPGAAVPFLDRAAQRDQLEAAHMLATLYRDGQGVTRNATRAHELYERAAAREHAPSMFNLADMLRSGGAEDRARAAALFRSLACLNDNRQIQSLAQARLRGMREAPARC